MNIKKMSTLVIDALEDIKAKNIVVINVSKLTSLFDYIVVASGDSNRQTKALANHVKEKLKEAGATVYGSEGEETGEWVLVDLGDIVVHIMQPVTREYYRLEELWQDGKIEFPKPEKKEAAPKAAPKATPKPAAKAKAGAGTKKPAAVKKKPATTRKTTAKTTTATSKKPAAKPRTTAKAAPKAKSTAKAKA